MPADMKQIISSSYLEMAQKKDLDKITVTDLVNHCHISRQCFYYHFNDIYNVVELLVEQILKEALTQCQTSQTLEKGLFAFISTLYENHILLQKTLHSHQRDFVEKKLLESIYTYLKEAIILTSPDVTVNLSNSETYLKFCSYGIAGLLIEHFQSEQPDIPKLVFQISKIIKSK